jgi:hypothetical protein
MRLTIFIALAAVGLLPAEVRAQSWQEYKPAGIGFRIELPRKPDIQTDNSSGRTSIMAIATYRDLSFFVAHRDPGPGASAAADRLLDAIVKAHAEKKKVLRANNDPVGGLPSRRILVQEAGKLPEELRLIVINDRLVQALFIGPADDPLGKRFLDSFALVKD